MHKPTSFVIGLIEIDPPFVPADLQATPDDLADLVSARMRRADALQSGNRSPRILPMRPSANEIVRANLQRVFGELAAELAQLGRFHRGLSA